MDTGEGYRRASEWTAGVVASVEVDQMDSTTPCDDWDVRTVMDHLVRNNLLFAAGVEGEDIADKLPADTLGDDGLVAYRRSADAVLVAMDTEGAPEVTLPNGMPASFFYNVMVTEQLLHGWDLARATGQDTTLNPELIAMTDAIIRPLVESGSAGAVYAPSFDAGADASHQDKLLALVGRHA